jgi:hypothetical protein
MIAITVFTRLSKPAAETVRRHTQAEKGVEITGKKSCKPHFSSTTGQSLELLTMPAFHATNIISVLEPLRRTGRGHEVVNAETTGAHDCSSGRILPAWNVASGKIEGNGDDHKPGEPKEEGKVGILSDGGLPGAKEFGPCPVPEPGQQHSSSCQDRDAKEPAHRNFLPCPAASMLAVLFSDIFHTQGNEDSAEEDEAGQPDMMGDTVVIDIGGNSRLEQLRCQGPP